MAAYELPENAAVILGSNIKFKCDPFDTYEALRWNVYPMSIRPDDPSAWRWFTVALDGKLVESSTKYTLHLPGRYEETETLEIHNVTREDAAVVECHHINIFRRQAQLVILGEHILCLLSIC